jgi:hypothetical protein
LSTREYTQLAARKVLMSGAIYPQASMPIRKFTRDEANVVMMLNKFAPEYLVGALADAGFRLIILAAIFWFAAVPRHMPSLPGPEVAQSVKTDERGTSGPSRSYVGRDTVVTEGADLRFKPDLVSPTADKPEEIRELTHWWLLALAVYALIECAVAVASHREIRLMAREVQLQ